MSVLRSAIPFPRISWKHFSQETRILLTFLSEKHYAAFQNSCYGSDGAKLWERTWRSSRFFTLPSFLRIYDPHRLLFSIFSLTLRRAQSIWKRPLARFQLFRSISLALSSRNIFYLYAAASLCVHHYRFAFSSLSQI